MPSNGSQRAPIFWLASRWLKLLWHCVSCREQRCPLGNSCAVAKRALLGAIASSPDTECESLRRLVRHWMMCGGEVGTCALCADLQQGLHPPPSGYFNLDGGERAPGEQLDPVSLGVWLINSLQLGSRDCPQRHALLTPPPAETDSPLGIGFGASAMDCIDGNSVWQHMLTCFDPGCPDQICHAGKVILRHRLSCQDAACLLCGLICGHFVASCPSLSSPKQHQVTIVTESSVSSTEAVGHSPAAGLGLCSSCCPSGTAVPNATTTAALHAHPISDPTPQALRLPSFLLVDEAGRPSDLRALSSAMEALELLSSSGGNQ